MFMIDPYRFEDQEGGLGQGGNWGAELGNLTFWTVISGNPQVRANQPARHPPEGVAIFDGGTSPSSIMEQEIDLTLVPNLDLVAVAAGTMNVRVVWWGGTFEQGGNDQPQLHIRFEDSGGAGISTYSSGYKTPTTLVGQMRWTEYTEFTDIPATTRYVVIRCEMKRNSGVNNDAAFDDIRVSFEAD